MVCLLACCLPTMVAAGESAYVDVHEVGRVAIDSGVTLRLNPPAKDLVVAWIAADGTRVAPGDVVVRFDSVLIQDGLPARQRALAIAKMELERARSSRLDAIADLESRRHQLRGDYRTVRAQIERLLRVDPEQIALLQAEYQNAVLAAEIAERENGRCQAELAQGRISVESARAATHAAEQARLAVARPQQAVQLAQHPDELSHELVVLRQRCADIGGQLGVHPDGSEDPRKGIGERITALNSQIEADLNTVRGNVDKLAAELHESIRDLRDHTPMVSVDITTLPSKQVVARYLFAPSGHNVAGSTAVDRGLPFTAVRGYGWSRPCSVDELVWRDKVESKPLPAGMGTTGSKDGGKGRTRKKVDGGRGGQSGYVGGVALIAEPATWSCSLPSGRYAVKVGLGDNCDWDGAVVRIEGKPLSVPVRIPVGITEADTEVDVTDGRLDIAIGDAEMKTIRAPVAGAVVAQGTVKAGFRVTDQGQSLAFLAGPESLVVDVLVAQDLAPMLGRAKPRDGGDLQSRIRLNGIEVRRLNGVGMSAEIQEVGAQSVRYSRNPDDREDGNPADRIARELRLALPKAERAELIVGQAVDVRLRFSVPDGATTLLPHLVRIDREGAVIQEVEAVHERGVQAVRIGRQVVVDALIDPTHLRSPGPRQTGPIESSDGRFRGEVVPGARTRVSLSWVRGRVETLLPDGSQVKAGDVVLTIHDPKMEADSERAARDRQAAIREVLAAAERRHQDQLNVSSAHETRIVAETQARTALRQLYDVDDVAQLNVRLDEDLARLHADAARESSGRLAQLKVPPSDDVARAKVNLELALLNQDRARLSASAWDLALDWVKSKDTAASWLDRVAALGQREAEMDESTVQERI
ncbi:MAG: hypothetical protein AAB263_19630, partial [Planctomycetota bacterium]